MTKLKTNLKNNSETIAKIIAKDLAYNWHPFTQMKHHEANPPIPIKRAEGCYLIDMNDTPYLDTISSWWCTIHGHSHPAIVSAIQSQAATLCHTLYAGTTHQPVADLSERLVSITPDGLDRVFYTDNGSTAIEMALKCSVAYFKRKGFSQKNRFVSLEHGYHGDTLGCMSVSHVSEFNQEFSALATPAIKIPVPIESNKPDQLNMKGFITYCTNVFSGFLKSNNNEIAALVVEPLLQAAGGFRMYPPQFLDMLGSLCASYNVHLIVDEVATGFGRTGRYFAVDHVPDLRPDFLCLSKGLTSGTMPLAATLTTQKIYDAFYNDSKQEMFAHGHTYCANPLGCAVALATLSTFETENTLNHVQQLTDMLSTKHAQFSAIPGVLNIRQLGSILAMTIPNLPVIHTELCERGRSAGFWLRPLGTTLYFMPPLSIPIETYAHLVDTVAEILTEILPA
jgi:adenosylmethionine---8-amino-7-oxononanoate aminotransferase|tara:strand:- start:521 stop:1876 length:1356 start_codon:yes stop_codon:yes gene_type:complete